MLLAKLSPDEQDDKKSRHDADSRATLQAGVHRIYLPAPVDGRVVDPGGPVSRLRNWHALLLQARASASTGSEMLSSAVKASIPSSSRSRRKALQKGSDF
jgi:hypothetical protein